MLSISRLKVPNLNFPDWIKEFVTFIRSNLVLEGLGLINFVSTLFSKINYQRFFKGNRVTDRETMIYACARQRW